LWFTEPGGDRLVSISDNAAGTMSQYAVPTADAGLSSIAPDLSACTPSACADRGMWFTESNAGQVGHVSPKGSIAEYPLPTATAQPSAIAGAPAGGAWFTEPSANRVGHIDPHGDIDQYRIPTANASAQGLASGTGPDGGSSGAWFSETSADQLGFISSSGQFSEFTIPGASPGGVAFAPSI